MKLTHGVGYNSGVKHPTKKGGQRTKSYQVWRDMLKRCYKAGIHKNSRNSAYKDCIVCAEWLDFQNFAKWYENNEYYGLGYELDKDILSPKNKIYCPEFCRLVPQELNKLTIDRGKMRGKYPQGVSKASSGVKYRSDIHINGKTMYIGLFDTPEEAHQAYKEAKERHVKNMANKWRDRIAPEVYEALMSWELEK